MSNPQIKISILDAIDQLRKRKARPDLSHISHMLRRKYKIEGNVVEKELELLVAEESVVKVDYKGNTSYRNAAKWLQNRHQLGSILNPEYVSQSIFAALKDLGADKDSKPASLADIEKVFRDRNIPIPDLNVAMDREVNSGRIKRMVHLDVKPLKAPLYVLRIEPSSSTAVPIQRPTAVPLTIPQISPTNITTSIGANFQANCTPARRRGRPPKSIPLNSAENKQMPKTRGRPASKRLKIKKSHGPDFVEIGSMKSEDDDFEQLCCHCFLGACNAKGNAEELITCEKCHVNKTHPSCDPNKDELLNCQGKKKSWQCLDCLKKADQENQCSSNNSMNGSSNFSTESTSNSFDNEPTEFDKSISFYPNVIPDVSSWSCDEVYRFFCHVQPGKDIKRFKELEIDGKALLNMTRDDLLYRLDIIFGLAVKLYVHLDRLQTRVPDQYMRRR